ncbi:MAG: AtpZ/AtpI family protein [Deltaproteobacteria bacterium]|nr:AtpZ/AtpI family protein [Deltaproteobacteria bacterium]
MMIARDHRTTSSIFLLSAWGFVIAIASIVFLYAGYWLDQVFDSAPTFMLGLFLLAVFMSIWRLYREAWQRRNDV